MEELFRGLAHLATQHPKPLQSYDCKGSFPQTYTWANKISVSIEPTEGPKAGGVSLVATSSKPMY